MSACHFVVLDKVSVRYGNGEDSVQALDDASLKFEQGDFTAAISAFFAPSQFEYRIDRHNLRPGDK